MADGIFVTFVMEYPIRHDLNQALSLIIFSRSHTFFGPMLVQLRLVQVRAVGRWGQVGGGGFQQTMTREH